MDKVGMLDTLNSLYLELTKRLADEEHSTNDSSKVTEYKRQLQQIKAEIDRINRGKSYSRGNN
jgi:hypothetical protein